MSKGRHPKADVAEVLAAAKAMGLFVIEDHNGHRWGYITCASCAVSRKVWGTPRSPAVHAKQLARFASEHLHVGGRSPNVPTQERRERS